MGGEEGNKPFTFNFFESESATGESPVSAAAEAAAQAQAEAEADAILAGGNLRGPRGEGGEEDWSYQEQAEELIGLPKFAPAAASEVQLPGCDIRLAKCCISSDEAAQLLGEHQLQESDLVPGKYEGGFKLWEGAIDLAAYLANVHGLTAADIMGLRPKEGTGLESLKVLELGCGHGLPGILCLLAGAEVHFQDYNAQVLTSLTAPNVAANLAKLPFGAVRQQTRYFAGDWLAVGNLLSSKGLNAGYSLVLTAETIYNEQGARRLLECIKQVLTPPHGVALVAAKSHYFGVGGSTASFAALVAADGTLEAQRVWVLEDGTSNKREVLKVTFPAAIAPYFL